jgi:hypothetical protein
MRFDYIQGRKGRQRRIHRVAAASKHFFSSRGRKRMGTNHDAAIKPSRLRTHKIRIDWCFRCLWNRRQGGCRGTTGDKKARKAESECNAQSRS